MKHLILFALGSLLFSFSSHAQTSVEAVTRKKTDQKLVRGFKSGANEIEITADGTLKWNTGATLTNASDFRVSAGLAIGTNVQAYDVDLTTYAGISPSANVQTLLGAADFAAMRTALGLVIGTNVQAFSAVLDAVAGADSQTAGQVLVTTGGPGGTLSFTNSGASLVDLNASSIGSGTLPAARIGAASIDLTTKVTGALPLANGGTNATTAAAARVSLLPALAGNAGKVLAVNGGETDYELATISSGLTINTTTTSGAASGDILTSDGTLLQKLTPGTGVATWLATPTLANLNSAVSDADIARTDAANTFSGTHLFTNISSANSTNLSVVAGAGSSRIYLGGNAVFGGQMTVAAGEGATLYDSGGYRWSSDGNSYGTPDAGLARASAGVVKVTNGSSGLGALQTAALTIGSGGSAISKVLSATVTLDYDLSAVVVEDKTITVTGAAVGDVVVIGVPHGSVTTTAQFTAWVSAADTVTIRCVTDAAGENPASNTFRATVIQH